MVHWGASSIVPLQGQMGRIQYHWAGGHYWVHCQEPPCPSQAGFWSITKEGLNVAQAESEEAKGIWSRKTTSTSHSCHLVQRYWTHQPDKEEAWSYSGDKSHFIGLWKTELMAMINNLKNNPMNRKKKMEDKRTQWMEKGPPPDRQKWCAESAPSRLCY